MAESVRTPEHVVLSYETPPRSRDWPLLFFRVIAVLGCVAWLACAAGMYHLIGSMSDSPGPVWLDASFSLTVGILPATPIFGVGLLVRRFGHRMSARWGGSARRVYSFCARKWLERRPGR